MRRGLRKGGPHTRVERHKVILHIREAASVVPSLA